MSVVQILPRGAEDFLSRESWGLSGTAYSLAELKSLLDRLLDGKSPAAAAVDGRVFARFREPAKARIADEILAHVRAPAGTIRGLGGMPSRREASDGQRSRGMPPAAGVRAA